MTAAAEVYIGDDEDVEALQENDLIQATEQPPDEPGEVPGILSGSLLLRPTPGSARNFPPYHRDTLNVAQFLKDNAHADYIYP